MPVIVRSCNSCYTVSGKAPAAHKRKRQSWRLTGLVLFMSGKVSQRSDVLENVCTALLEEFTTCNTTCTMEVNWLERRENPKEAFQVPKTLGGITDTSLSS